MRRLYLLFLLASLFLTNSCKLIHYSVQDVIQIGYDSTVYVMLKGGHCTGFAIEPRIIVTAAHCVEEPVQFMKFKDKELYGEVLIDDDSSDVAIISLSESVRGLVPLMKSADQMRPGDELIGVGYPFYMENENITFNVGHFLSYASNGTLITDTVCYRGNSGGPVLDIYGRVVGICSKIAPAIDIYDFKFYHSHKDLNVLVPVTKIAALLAEKHA